MDAAVGRALPWFSPSWICVGLVVGACRAPEPTERASAPAPEPVQGDPLASLDKSVLDGLRWLARHQNPDGSWGALALHSRCTSDPPCYDPMLKATDRPHAPWWILRSDNKKAARLNGITHILSRIPYKRIKRPHVELPKRSKKHHYDDELNWNKVKVVPEHY